MLKFWNDTNLLESNLKSVKTGNRDPQFQQALIHLISCMVEAATATKKTKETEDGSKEESKKQNEEEEKKEEQPDLILEYFRQNKLFEALKALKARERDPSMRDEISISLKFMKVKIGRTNQQPEEDQQQKETQKIIDTTVKNK